MSADEIDELVRFAASRSGADLDAAHALADFVAGAHGRASLRTAQRHAAVALLSGWLQGYLAARGPGAA